jgi:hypothetical protein
VQEATDDFLQVTKVSKAPSRAATIKTNANTNNGIDVNLANPEQILATLSTEQGQSWRKTARVEETQSREKDSACRGFWLSSSQ